MFGAYVTLCAALLCQGCKLFIGGGGGGSVSEYITIVSELCGSVSYFTGQCAASNVDYGLASGIS